MPVLIDADILAHQIALNAEEPTQFDDYVWVTWADLGPATEEVDTSIEAIMEITGQEEAVLCLTGKNNFRYKVCDSYKANRLDKPRPMLLRPLREYMIDKHGAKSIEGLEGDDLIGILATGEHKDDHVIYSLDKDMQTIPGTHWAGIRHSDEREGAVTITPKEANAFFFKQVLTGDTTDGYKGCPGVGPVKAAKILEEECSWNAIVAAYEKAGLEEEDALIQARLAFILHASHYQDGKPVMWTPEEIEA